MTDQPCVDAGLCFCERDTMAADEELIDVREVVRGYSRTLLRDFEEDEKQTRDAKDRGDPRETGVRKFLDERLPQRYGVGEGYVLDRTGALSRQCDAVIFDRERMPRIETRKTGRLLYPCELVYGVVEVKSRLTEVALTDAVEKVAAFKALQRPQRMVLDYVGPGLPAVATTKKRIVNTSLGIVIAHAYGEDLDEDSRASTIDTTIASVSREQQLDALLVIGADLRLRGQTGGGVDLAGDTVNLYQGLSENALGAFFFALVSLLNTINLGAPSFAPYTRLLLDKDAST